MQTIALKDAAASISDLEEAAVSGKIPAMEGGGTSPPEAATDGADIDHEVSMHHSEPNKKSLTRISMHLTCIGHVLDMGHSIDMCCLRIC